MQKYRPGGDYVNNNLQLILCCVTLLHMVHLNLCKNGMGSDLFISYRASEMITTMMISTFMTAKNVKQLTFSVY